jgi:ubiquinone biosynthesis protein
MLFFRPRHLGRYRKIAEVMARHGFGAVVSQLGLEGTWRLPSRFLGREDQPTTSRSAAVHLREAMEELGPTFIKLGQIASTRPEVLPPAYLQELSKLQDDVPPAPWNEVQELLEEALGAPIHEVFLALDPTPIASASLAQVYAALLPDRTPVVVKVQRPNIESTIETDLAIISDLATLAYERMSWTRPYDPIGLAEEFSTALRYELDYQREARNADRFRANFAEEDHLYVPKTYWDYTTQRVLVQERIHGIKADNIQQLDAEGYDRNRIAMHAARLVIKEVMEDGFFHADPHPGNMVIMPGEVIGLMDFGTVGYLDNTDRANLVRLYIAVIQFDVVAIIEQLIRMGIASPSVDEQGLQRDLRRLLRKYYGLPLKEISAADLLSEIQPIIYAYHLRIPSDYWLLLKTLVIMEGVGKRLAPDFDVFEVSAPYVRRFLIKLALPTSWGPSLARSSGAWANLLIGFPRQSSRILDRLESGQMKFQVEVPTFEQTTKQFNQMANRLILAILVGTLTIALALLIPSLNLSWPWNFPTWLIVIGFVLMVMLSLWLIWSILRSNRR